MQVSSLFASKCSFFFTRFQCCHVASISAMMLSSPTGSSCTCQMKNSKSWQWTCSSGWGMMDISSSVSRAIILQETWKTLKTPLCTEHLRRTLISSLLSNSNFLMEIFQHLKWWPNVQWKHMLRCVATNSNVPSSRKYPFSPNEGY